jgi:hypothetical protein
MKSVIFIVIIYLFEKTIELTLPSLSYCNSFAMCSGTDALRNFSFVIYPLNQH